MSCPSHTLFSFVLLLLYTATTCIAASVEIDPNGQQHQHVPQRSRPRGIKAKFINTLSKTAVNLYWAGNQNSLNERSLQMYYGPIEPKGGERTIDGYSGQVFVLTEVGSYERLGEYMLGSNADITSMGIETYILTGKSAKQLQDDFASPKTINNEKSRRDEIRCRSLHNAALLDDNWGSFSERCQRCAEADGCGFSPVRDRCFASHAVATVNTVAECNALAAMEEAEKMSVDAWLNRAMELMLSGGMRHGNRSGALRMAYKCLEKAAERSNKMLTKAHDKKDKSLIKAAETMDKKAHAALLELTAKLEAVFDDVDAKELLESSRHPKLAEIHPIMPAVHRRTAKEAIEYILRGEPVVITDMFDDAPNPVTDKWTLEYLNREVFSAAGGDFSPKFNVAADRNTQCCLYYEPQGKAQRLEYPYPFSPTTHLYRDTFDGFVKTVRKTNRNTVAGSSIGAKSTKPRLLHYLHEIVMNKDGNAAVAGGKAPAKLEDDLSAVTSQLRPLASKQPFFASFAFAKMWLGQKGIVMPIHYDATDNLYVMAWGRKRAIIGEPGQLDALYRYPNGHPLVGSSQVNLTEPDLKQYPHFKDANLREVIVGPGDVLYLPAWWWHQFEQPFEDTAALNLWSKDRNDAPDSQMRHAAVREHVLADQLEESVSQNSGKDAGIIFDALAKGESSPHYTSVGLDTLKRAKNSMLRAANNWQREVSQLPGGHPKMKLSAATLVEDHLDRTHRNVMKEMDPKVWRPGMSWNTTETTVLPRELRNRCEAAPESSPFMSICG